MGSRPAAGVVENAYNRQHEEERFVDSGQAATVQYTKICFSLKVEYTVGGHMSSSGHQMQLLARTLYWLHAYGA
jgi:hypothetical protein